MDLNLRGRTALITGASKGIGRGAAEVLDGPMPSDHEAAGNMPGALAWWGPASTEPLVTFPVPNVNATYSVAPDGLTLAVDNTPSYGQETLVDLVSHRQPVFADLLWKHFDCAQPDGLGFGHEGS